MDYSPWMWGVFVYLAITASVHIHMMYNQDAYQDDVFGDIQHLAERSKMLRFFMHFVILLTALLWPVAIFMWLFDNDMDAD